MTSRGEISPSVAEEPKQIEIPPSFENRSESQPSCFTKIKKWAKSLKIEVYALFLAYKGNLATFILGSHQHRLIRHLLLPDPRTPIFAKIFAILVVCYAFSPIDLIPDFIPILGMLDDIIIIPLGIYICLKLVPENVMVDCRIKAKEILSQKKKQKPFGRYIACASVICCYLICFYLSYKLYLKWASSE